MFQHILYIAFTSDMNDTPQPTGHQGLSLSDEAIPRTEPRPMPPQKDQGGSPVGSTEDKGGDVQSLKGSLNISSASPTHTQGKSESVVPTLVTSLCQRAPGGGTAPTKGTG